MADRLPERVIRPDQLISWADPDGQRHSEHRSIGAMDETVWHEPGRAPAIMVFVRRPRPDDPYHVVCCTDPFCKPRPLEGWITVRPTVIGAFRDRDDAYALAENHAAGHTLARLPFRRRRSELYRRQARVERALA